MQELDSVFNDVADRIRQQGVFDAVDQAAGSIICKASEVESEAQYRACLEPGGARLWIGLYTPDRWLSESIEADLMHLGDKLEELLEEELVDQGFDGVLPVEHFRDDDKQYVFRSPIACDARDQAARHALADRLSRALLAYEATFSQLGDMKPADEAEL